MFVVVNLVCDPAMTLVFISCEIQVAVAGTTHEIWVQRSSSREQ
jgi:hypothetical protein